MKVFEVWREGYSITGNSDKAALVTTVEAENFYEGLKKLEESGDYGISMYRGEYVIWGCRLFSNEYEARKSFG